MVVSYPTPLSIFKKEKGKAFHLISHSPSHPISRHINMDYSICHGLSYNSKGLNALLSYDIACQWSKHFRERTSTNKYLPQVNHDGLTFAVGKFHLSAHIPTCFPRFSLNFIHGAGQQDGEILETLWAEFNKISKSARTMSKAHRAEVYDDHMRHSNWEKMDRMGE